MQAHPIEIRNPVTNKIIGMLCEVHGLIKYIPIERNVVAAMRAFHEAMDIPYDNSEPEWEDLSEEEDRELSKLNGIDNIIFLKRQAI